MTVRLSRVSPSRAAAPVLVGLLLLGASACGADDRTSDSAASSLAAAVAAPVPPNDALARIADGANLIDVRTPGEFDEGHLDGAANIDVEEDDFEERVSELPRDASYVVYCVSGRRATIAVEQMLELGFTDVVNGGSYDDLARS